MIELSRTGLRCDADREELHREFSTLHTLRLPQLFSHDLAKFAAERARKGAWTTYSHPGIGEELALDDELVPNLFDFLLGGAAFLELMREITGIPHLHSFGGRVYKMCPGGAQYDSWHNDIVDDADRLVGLSINLSERPYTGGVFELRNAGEEHPFRALPNTVLGDAIVFRIDGRLQHRVSDVTGWEPKTAFAGWFCSSGTDSADGIRKAAKGFANGT